MGEGYKDITLLGQNVNSYAGGITFAQLLKEIDAIPGEFRIRFMGVEEGVQGGVSHLLHQVQRLPEVLPGLPGEAHDDIVTGDAGLAGQFAEVEIVSASHWAL